MADQGLCRISFLVLFFLVVGSVYSADRRQAKVKKDETIEDYLKDHTVEVEPPSRNASPLDLCILSVYKHVNASDTSVCSK